MKICLCVGTRPNFIKAAPLIRAFEKYEVDYRLVYTGQHYDYNMAGVFFEELGIPKPDVELPYHSYSKRLWRVTETIVAMRQDCEIYKPDIVIVLGDVDSATACTLAAKIAHIKIAHIEAGERCGDDNMIEESNRKYIDSMSNYLFCASENSRNNLISEDVDIAAGKTKRLNDIEQRVWLVGNTMIDQLKYIQPHLEKANTGKPYAVLTLHRAENVDDLNRLGKIHGIISKIAEKIKVIFPCHPRTKKQLEKDDFMRNRDGLAMVEPMSYLEFMKLVNNAKFVLIDSGGLQIETSYLNVPCITLRESTEWLETVSHGTNVITGIVEEDIIRAVKNILQGRWKHSKIKDMSLHDGKAAERIVEILIKEEGDSA